MTQSVGEMRMEQAEYARDAKREQGMSEDDEWEDISYRPQEVEEVLVG